MNNRATPASPFSFFVTVTAKCKELLGTLLTHVLRYSHFIFIVLRPKNKQLVAPVNDIFRLSAAQMKALPLCPVNGKDPMIAFFDQENGVCLNIAEDLAKRDKHQPRQRNRVSVVSHHGDICLMKTYQTLGCLINEVRSLDKLKNVAGVPKLIDISVKHRQVYQSLVPGTALSEILNENGITPVDLYLYENEMIDDPDYPRAFNPSTATKWLTPGFISQLSFMLNAIHDSGVLIRDVKFGNIMVQGDTPYLVDFDAATVLSGGSATDHLSVATENGRFNRLLPLNLPDQG
jgi:serine/threonine protein kinase